jgi:hypothetical protein
MATRVLVAALLLLVPPGAARAEEPVLRWSYSRGRGAESCPDGPALRRAITAQLGRDPFAGEGDDAVALDVRRARHQLRARIELRERDGAVLGARELLGHDCEELAPAMTLAIALAIDALAPRAPPAPPPPQQVALATAPPPALVAQAWDDEVPRIEAPPKPPPRWDVSLGLVAAVDATQLAVPGLTVQADFLRPRYSIGVELRGDLPLANSQGVTASLWTGTFVPCWRYKIAALCGLVSIGAELASTAELPLTSPVARVSMSNFWMGLGARVAVDLPLYQLLAMRLHADVIGPLLRPELRWPLQGEPSIVYYTTPVVSSAFGAALLARFP